MVEGKGTGPAPRAARSQPVEAAPSAPLVCNRCGFEVQTLPWGCRNPCANCGTMTDVTLPKNIEADLDRALALLAEQQHFTVDGHRLDIIGTCATCTETPRAQGERPRVNP